VQLGVAICALACRQKVAQVQPTAEPTARIVYVVVTATPEPQREAAALREREVRAPATPRAYSVPVAPMNARATAESVPNCVIQDFVTRLPDNDGDVWFAGDVVNVGPQPASIQMLVKAYTIKWAPPRL
jgi:hypothetical protein